MGLRRLGQSAIITLLTGALLAQRPDALYFTLGRRATYDTIRYEMLF